MIGIGYFADGPWAHEALRRIGLDGRFAVRFFVLRHGHADPVLRAAAEQLGVPCHVVPNVNDAGFVDTIRAHGADLFVSMSFDQILRGPIREAAPLGFINCHAGALPFYRGRNILNWALINGEERVGVTVHFVDDGIDTGDIIRQDFIAVAPADDYGSLLAKAYDACAETLTAALGDFAEGRVSRVSQQSIHPVGFYCPRRVPGDEKLDWNWPSSRVVNFVRGIALPGPGARTRLGEREIAILRAETIPDAPAYLAIPGAVVGRGPRGIVVKTGDTTVLVTSIAKIGEDGSLDEAEQPKLVVGSRFTAI